MQLSKKTSCSTSWLFTNHLPANRTALNQARWNQNNTPPCKYPYTTPWETGRDFEAVVAVFVRVAESIYHHHHYYCHYVRQDSSSSNTTADKQIRCCCTTATALFFCCCCKAANDSSKQRQKKSYYLFAFLRLLLPRRSSSLVGPLSRGCALHLHCGFSHSMTTTRTKTTTVSLMAASLAHSGPRFMPFLALQ